MLRKTIGILGIILVSALLIWGCGRKGKDSSEEKGTANQSESSVGEGEGETGELELFDGHGHLMPTWTDDFIKGLVENSGMSGMVLLGPAAAIDLQTNNPSSYTGCFFYEIGKSSIQQLESALNAGAKCIGELSVRHFASGGSDGTAKEGDSTELMEVYSTAAKFSVPINIHFDYSEEFIDEFESALSQNTNTIFVWAHMGDAQADTVRSMLDKHPNLYVDIPSRNPLYDRGLDIYDQQLVESDGKQIKESWRELFEDHADRVIFGTDIGPSDRDTIINDVVAHFRDLLLQLTPTTAAKIGSENAKGIYGLE